MEEEKQYHIALCRADIEGAMFAVLPGDPGRVPEIAREIDPEAIFLAQNREYTSWLARLNDDLRTPILVISTGIGCPSAAICIEELIKIGVNTFIRVGTSGSLQEIVQLGDIVICNASVKEDGTSKQYIYPEYPAVADHTLVTALRMAAKSLKLKVHVGIGHTKDAFYAESNDPSNPLNNHNQEIWKSWTKANVLATAMEASALYTIASIRKVRAAEILVAIGLTYGGEPLASQEEIKEIEEREVKNMTRIVVEAIKIITGWNKNPETCPF